MIFSISSTYTVLKAIIIQFSRKNYHKLLRNTSNMPYYAVRNGRKPGIYENWNECSLNVKGFSGAIFKKFSLKSDAEIFLHCEQKKLRTHSNRYQPYKSSAKEIKASKDTKLNLENITNKSIVYTDGACMNNGFDGAKAGIGVYWGENDPYNVAERLSGRQTNNRAEIHAAIKAIKQACNRNIKELVIKTDSNFLIKSYCEWLPKWQKNGWKTATGEEVKNKDDFIELINASKNITLTFMHVKGHSGIEGNEEADKLANLGANL